MYLYMIVEEIAEVLPEGQPVEEEFQRIEILLQEIDSSLPAEIIEQMVRNAYDVQKVNPLYANLFDGPHRVLIHKCRHDEGRPCLQEPLFEVTE